MLPYTCNSSTTIEFPLEEWNLSCKLLHHPSPKMQSILHQLPTNPWNTNSSELLREWKPLTQIKWIQQSIHTIQHPVLSTQHLVSFCQVSSFPWFGSQGSWQSSGTSSAPLRLEECSWQKPGAMETLKHLLQLFSFPFDPRAMLCWNARPHGKTMDWFSLKTSLNKDLNPKKTTKLILGSAGMGGNEMEWGNESQWYPKEG